MADLFSLAGQVGSVPASGSPSGAFQLIATLDESLTLLHKHQDTLQLTVDSPVVLNFGGVVSAHVVIMRVTGGKVDARITSADGTAQIVPIDPLLILISKTVPITAISLTRVATVDTTVEIFLGEQA